MRNEYDFSRSKKAGGIKHLADLHTLSNAKTRKTIMLDDDIIACFKQKAEQSVAGYQTLINQTLRNSLQTGSIDDEPVNVKLLRKVIREELASFNK